MRKIIKVSFPGGKRVNAKIGDTVVKTDQSLRNGGEGSAPAPFQHFLASIATCVALYALEFCRSRNLPLEGMEFAMICDFDPEARRHTKMIMELKLPAGFPKKFQPAIVRSMDLCAVKRHIINPPEFEIKTIFPGKKQE